MKDKIIFWLFKIFEKVFYKNKYGMVSGWWQSWEFDRKGWEYAISYFKTKKHWLTSELKIKFYKQLCSVDNLVWGAENIKCIKNKKGKKELTFDIVLWQNKDMISKANFIFIEEEKIICKLKNRSK